MLHNCMPASLLRSGLSWRGRHSLLKGPPDAIPQTSAFPPSECITALACKGHMHSAITLQVCEHIPGGGALAWVSRTLSRVLRVSLTFPWVEAFFPGDSGPSTSVGKALAPPHSDLAVQPGLEACGEEGREGVTSPKVYPELLHSLPSLGPPIPPPPPSGFTSPQAIKSDKEVTRGSGSLASGHRTSNGAVGWQALFLEDQGWRLQSLMPWWPWVHPKCFQCHTWPQTQRLPQSLSVDK